MDLSVVILTKNEEKNIIDCIESVSFADELIIIDDYSTDRTEEVAKGSNTKVKIYKRSLNDNFSAQRNFALSKTTKKWTLFIDADERVSPVLQKEIEHKIKKTDMSGFYIGRADIMWGKKLRYGEAGKNTFLRLGRTTGGIWRGSVHEKWEIEGQTAKFEEKIYHYPHPTISEFLNDINYYSSLRAKELLKQKKYVKAWEIIFYPVLKFKYNYILRLGMLDGIQGLVLAIMMSFHSFLVRSKAWLAQKKTLQV
ncbi:MAG: beta-1,4-glucosyltransferase [Candidatus Levybacteria bacterium CG10_big_fil_rev_8_21_14_0_10_36_7]|nr:MAG: beta-1,4-glucosyltransferase [Candidatus Levybacteria bacterium CG10_big_fil_rev_8_21_14_0_10_36_7]